MYSALCLFYSVRVISLIRIPRICQTYSILSEMQSATPWKTEHRLIMEQLWRSFLTFPTYLEYAMEAVRDKGYSSELSFSVSALFSVRDALLPFHLGTRRITYSG